MRNSKLFLAALAAVATVGFSAPAAATFSDPVSPVTLLGFDFTTSAERVQLTGSVINTPFPGPFIGAFYDDLDFGGGNQLLGQLVFCDDIGNDIDPDGVPYPFWFTTTPTGQADYLSPLPAATINDIVGLVYAATTDLNGLNPQQGAAYQLAIWDLEYGAANITVNPASDPTLQANADALVGSSAADYLAFLADGTFIAVQLESPCDVTLIGQITFQATPAGSDTNCQVQGQILVAPANGPFTIPVPEPGTLALLGSGLIGLGAFRRRRRKSA